MQPVNAVLTGRLLPVLLVALVLTGGSMANAAKPDPAVLDLQTELEAMGFAPGPADGLMGRKTRTAMQQFLSSLQKDEKASVEETLAIIQDFDARRKAVVRAWLNAREDGPDPKQVRTFERGDGLYIRRLVAPTAEASHGIFKDDQGRYRRISSGEKAETVPYKPRYAAVRGANPYEVLLHFVNLQTEIDRPEKDKDACDWDTARQFWRDAWSFTRRAQKKIDSSAMSMSSRGDPGGPDYEEHNKLWCINAAMMNVAMNPGYELPDDAIAMRTAFAAKKEAEAARAKAEAEAQARREAEQAQEKAALAAVAAKAAALNDAPALEALLDSEPDRDRRDPIVERLEILHRDDVLPNGPGCRPVVKDLRIDPPDGRPGVSVMTVSSMPGRPGLVQMGTELKHDRMMFSLGDMMGFGGAKQKSDTWVHGNIHRVKAQYDVGGYETAAIASTGDKYHRMTFLLVHEVGYVYLRGTGVIRRKDGTALTLPDDLTPDCG
jgi:hypothetical protein